MRKGDARIESGLRVREIQRCYIAGFEDGVEGATSDRKRAACRSWKWAFLWRFKKNAALLTL